MIIDRSKSQQDIGTQIDRLGGEFQKKERSGEIHELERYRDQNSGGMGEMLPVGEYLGHRPIPQVAGGGEKEKEERLKRKEGKNQTLWKLNSTSVVHFHGKYA